MSNLGHIATTSVCDGLKLLFRNVETDRMQQDYEKLYDVIQEATALPTGVLSRLIKFKVIRGEASKHGSLYSIFLVGDAARAYATLPWRYAAAVVEMHLKTYLVEKGDGSLEDFQDKVWEAPTIVNMSFIKSKPRKGNSKASGDKGLRIGSRKSDKHAVVYRRQKEHAGFEVRVRDAEMRAALLKVEMVRASIVEAGQENGDAESWWLLKAIVARLGYAYAMKLIRGMGVNLADYFKEVTPNPDSASGTVFVPLSSSEEVEAIGPSTLT